MVGEQDDGVAGAEFTDTRMEAIDTLMAIFVVVLMIGLNALYVAAEFGDDLPVLDGGACPVGIESAIVDCTRGRPQSSSSWRRSSNRRSGCASRIWK